MKNREADLSGGTAASRDPSGVYVGVDLASGPDRAVAVAVQRDENGALRMVDCEELPPGTVSVVGYDGRAQGKTHAADALAYAFALEDDVPFPSERRIEGAVDTLKYVAALRPAKSSLVVTILECGPVFVLQARGPGNHVVQYTNDKGVVGFASREDAKLFMPDVCAQYWRRHG